MKAEAETKGHAEIKVQIQTGPKGADRESSISFFKKQTHAVRQWQYSIEFGAVVFLVCIDKDCVLDTFGFGVPRITFLYAPGNRSYPSL